MALDFNDGSYNLIGTAMQVYNHMGPGYLEEVYQECMELELGRAGIRFEAHPTIDLFYKGEKLTQHFGPDLLVGDKIVVELKAQESLHKGNYAQVLNCLKGTGKGLSFLFNFGKPGGLEWKRLVA